MVFTTARGRSGTHGIVASFLVLLNFTLFAVMTAIAAHIYNTTVEGHTRVAANVAASNAVLMALVAGSVGMATSLLGILHSAAWNEMNRVAALSANIITMALTWLTAGVASRAIRSHAFRAGTSSYRGQALTVAAFSIILMLTTLLYVMHLGLFTHEKTSAVTTAPAAGVGHHHNKVVNGGNTGYGNEVAAPVV